MASTISSRKIEDWRRRLARFRESQLSVTAFCRQEGVSPPSFYAWRKRLHAAARPQGVGESTPNGFRPVRLLPMSGVSVQLTGGTQLIVPTGDVESLRAVIETVVRVDADRSGDAHRC
jgi:hypothetical protein